MIKIIPIIFLFIFILYLTLRPYSEHNIYTPNYELLYQSMNVEIRKYDSLKIMTVTEKLPYKEATYSGFRKLASYIFGNNADGKKFSMTAPVITSEYGEGLVNVSFVIQNHYVLNEMPKPNSKEIYFHELNLNKVAAIRFGFWATSSKIQSMQVKLESYLKANSLDYMPIFYVAQYNSPWILPPFRKNEIMVSIIS